ncbi:unnamed protein product, partial [Ranitomeya imitator]
WHASGWLPQQDPMYGYFLAIAGQDGQIDADELQRCLSQAGMSGGYSRKCPEKIQIIGDLQKNNEKRDYSGKLGFNEFKELGMALNSWRQNFMTFDVDRSGTIGPMELHSARWRPWVRPLHIKRRCSDTDNDPDRCSVAVWSLESCHTDRSPATNDAGNQGKHRRDYSGKLGFNEFKELGMALNSWRQNFMTFDVDRSGTIGPMELHRAVATMGYRLSPQALNIIAKRYSTHGKIKFDDYVSCCVRLRAMTDSFRRRDVAQQGMVNFQYDDVSIAILLGHTVV